jgi:hypothetical protein
MLDCDHVLFGIVEADVESGWAMTAISGALEPLRTARRASGRLQCRSPKSGDGIVSRGPGGEPGNVWCTANRTFVHWSKSSRQHVTDQNPARIIFFEAISCCLASAL